MISVGAEAARRDMLDALDELERALAREREALATRNGDQLERCAQDKAASVRTVETATQRLQASGGRLDQAGDQELLRRARACLHANRVNGGMIELNRNFVARLLDTLRGGSPGGVTYDAHGRLGRSGHTRPVAHA